jgi:hypothetical protein
LPRRGILRGTVANTEHGKVNRQPLDSLQRGLNPLQADAVSVADLPLSGDLRNT